MLEKERQAIDELDQKIVHLLEERFKVVKEVALKKAEIGKPVLDAKREALLLEKITGFINEPEHEPFLLAIYQEILTDSKRYQEQTIAALDKDQ